MCIYSWMGGKLTMLTELTNITAQLEPNAGTTTRVPGLQIFSHSLCVGATRDCEMSETWRGSYVYNSLGAAARHIQQHFPSVYLCTYNIVSLLWASHSCYSSIHLLTHFAVFSLCSPLCAGLCFCHFSRSLSLSSLSRLFSVCLLIFFLICCLFLSVSATYFLCSLFVGLFSLSHFESQGSVASLWKTGRYSVVTQFVPVCFPLSPAALCSFWLSLQAAERHTTNTCTLTVGSELTFIRNTAFIISHLISSFTLLGHLPLPSPLSSCFACVMLLGWVSTLLHGYWTRTTPSHPFRKKTKQNKKKTPLLILNTISLKWFTFEMQMKRDVKSEAGWASAPPLLSCCLFTVLKITLHIAQNTLVASNGWVCFVCCRAERPLDLHWDPSPHCVHIKKERVIDPILQ